MYIIVGLIIFVCALLVLAVLAQNSKGGGLSSQFTGTSSNQLMGVKRTGDLLEQITWGLAISLIILCLSTTFLLDTSSGGQAQPHLVLLILLLLLPRQRLQIQHHKLYIFYTLLLKIKGRNCKVPPFYFALYFEKHIR
jgi:protein translocase SecG subunit